MTLAAAGFSVEAICPRGHVLAVTTIVNRLHRYKILHGISSFKTAILESNPALVVPCDDLARDHLHRLHEAGEFREVIERSLGDPASYPVLESRSRLLTLLRQEVDSAVETTAIPSAAGLREWQAANGYPAVFKTDGSSGGYGMRVVANEAEAEAARRKLSSPPGLARAVKRALFNRNTTFLLPAWKGASPAVNAQKFIPGTEMTSTAVCWRGGVLAVLTFEVLRVMYRGGPASVVRAVEHPAIGEIVKKAAGRLGISGFCGFDFIIEESTGLPRLIELNPRATQTVHLRLDARRDAAGALFTAATGEPAGNPPGGIPGDIVALFPQEWVRDPTSEFLRTGYHDVPWSEPALLDRIAASTGKHSSDLPRPSRQEPAALIPRK